MALLSLVALGRPATADEVLPRESGYVSLGVGARYLPHGSFQRRMQEAGIPVKHLAVQPGGFLGFGYKVDPNWVVAIEAGAGTDRLGLEAGRRLELVTLSLQISGQYAIPLGPEWLEPYVHAGVGYWLSTIYDVAGERKSAEGTTNGLSAGAGVRIALGRQLGLVVDGRWIWARQPTLGHGPITVGGGLATVGMQWVVRDTGHR